MCLEIKYPKEFQIEIFKTNISSKVHSENIISILNHHFPEAEFNVDLWEPDKVLRAKSKNIKIGDIEKIVKIQGFECIIID